MTGSHRKSYCISHAALVVSDDWVSFGGRGCWEVQCVTLVRECADWSPEVHLSSGRRQVVVGPASAYLIPSTVEMVEEEEENWRL